MTTPLLRAPRISRLRSFNLHLVLILGLAAPAAAQSPRDSLLVSHTWLAERLGDPRLVVLQVERTPGPYAEAHVPGARLVPFSTIVVERDGVPSELPPLAQLDSVLEAVGVSTGSRVVIVGEPLLAARLFFTLDYLGMGDRVALLDGGLPTWRAAGHPVSQEIPLVAPSDFDPRPRPELLADADWIRSRLGDERLLLLDARPESEFRGETAGDGVSRPGHLPGAQGFFWRLALTSREPAQLKSGGELTTLLADVGLQPGREVVTYCRTGVQASYLYFVARTLGYAPRLYDGSFIDWSRRSDLPVE